MVYCVVIVTKVSLRSGRRSGSTSGRVVSLLWAVVCLWCSSGQRTCGWGYVWNGPEATGRAEAAGWESGTDWTDSSTDGRRERETASSHCRSQSTLLSVSEMCCSSNLNRNVVGISNLVTDQFNPNLFWNQVLAIQITLWSYTKV